MSDVATSLVAARASQTQDAIMARLVKMNVEQDGQVVSLLDKALETSKATQAATAPGVGGVLDVTA